MNNEHLYIIKYNRENSPFNQYTVVKLITLSDSGKCYLVADLYEDNKREWIMYYDLYPVFEKDWSFREYKDNNLELIRTEILQSLKARS